MLILSCFLQTISVSAATWCANGTSGDVEAEDKTDATAPAPSVKENLKLLLDALTAPSLT